MEWGGFLVHVLFFLITCMSFICYKRNKEEPRKKANLPPGSMGWPYIGETLQFYSQDPSKFFATKQKRYGEIFKTHLLGCPCVMLASPEAARFVLVTQAHLFKPTYPKSKENLIGPRALFFHQGDYHTHLRKLVKGSLSPGAICNIVGDIEAIAASVMDSWSGGHVINAYHEMKRFSFEVGILAIFGHLEAHYKEELKENYRIVDRGYNSFAANIPGTLYNKAHLARKRLSKILSEIIGERKEKRLLEKDLLGCLLNSKNDKGEILSDDQIADNIIGVLFAAQDTTASIMTWIIKYLHDYPKLLEAVKTEQKAIHQSNKESNYQLTWTQTRKMPITHRVMLESLRMASIISFTFREAVADVEYNGKIMENLIHTEMFPQSALNNTTEVNLRKGLFPGFECQNAGYLIPKGWKVMPLFRNNHHNPEFFSNPHIFDPSRFEAAPKPNTFMPFGSGVHACPGNELAKLEILIMIHHLVSKFRWELVGSQNGIQYSPFPVPLHGLPARFWKESSI